MSEELSRNYNVVVIDDLSTGRAVTLKELDVECITGSVTDLSLFKKTFEDADYVFHHAAIASVQKSIEDPLLTNDVNLEGTLKVLIAARDCQVKKVIFASSSAVYGDKTLNLRRGKI